MDLTAALSATPVEPLTTDLGAVGAAAPVNPGSDFKGGGAIFSAGAFGSADEPGCTAGAPGVGSVFTPCAKTAPALHSNSATVVDSSRRFLMDVSLGHSTIVCFLWMCRDNSGRPRLVPNCQ